jgi:hypothetical protein
MATRYFKCISRVFIWLLLSAALLTVPALAQEQHQEVDIASAVAQGLVDMDVQASGRGYYGPGTLVMNITNLTGQPLTVVIPQGLRFRSEDASYQDEIVATDTRVDLDPGETAATDLTSFCGNAHRASPASGTQYDMGAMEDRQMQNLLSAIEEAGLQDTMEGQWAVWNQTDGMPAMPDFTRVLDVLDELGSDGVVRDVAESGISISSPLVSNVLRVAWLKTFLWWIVIGAAILLALLLLWWLLRRRPKSGPVGPPGRREGYVERKPKPKKMARPGADITHGRSPKPPRRDK